ncbi:ArsR family transcriptional regulator [Iocasia frigidifontis]|uniref:ArsR family transcriptional regulator n=1 Tax=Iocasia fonsfrigidae TaxID=2682810 RepID=A0A8A7KIT2_9FIRM|nr:winged helix-turn-helix domain-containing protein [Iocasia fonsfrigidae]QTL98747.1 ArsR family transcriptional regulator [Iocasia fonsfrigidae]
MKKIQIKYNPVLEFFCSIGRIIYNKEMKLNKWFNTFDFNEDIQNYIKNVNSNMSSLMKNDMDILTKKFIGGLVVPIYFCLSENITVLNDFFIQFAKLTGADFFRMYTKIFDITSLLDDEPAIIMKVLKEKLNVDFPSEDDKLFPEFKKHPEEIKNRLEVFFKFYYEKFYRKIEDKPIEFMRNKLGDYKRQYETDGIEFLSNLLALDMENLVESHNQIFLYPSYFYEIGMTQHLTNDSMCILFGHLLEQRVNVNFKQRRAKEILKILGDEKRYEILKLLGKRKYFGVELAEAVNLTKATISYHTNKMMALGLLNLHLGENNRVYFSLNKKTLKEMLEYVYQDMSSE